MIFLTSVLLQSYLIINGINDLRKYYAEAIKSSKISNQLIETLSQKQNLTALEIGYLGSTQMIMAKHNLFPWDKYNTFIKGKENLEKAIRLEPNNVELIYLRYLNQTNTPAFLQYHANIVDDRKFLESNLKQLQDEELKTMIKNYLQSKKM